MKKTQHNRNRDGERGAAMVMVLMISFLLMVASVGLIIETSMQGANVTDASSEQQAYNAAESGLQAALSVLRGHAPPNPLLDPTVPASHPNNKISFKRAVNLTTSNTGGDTSTQSRLSRWMAYNYTVTGGTNPDRITLGPGSYDPNTGYAYRVSVQDPDNVMANLNFNVSSTIDGTSGPKTVNNPLSPGSSATLAINGNVSGNLDLSSGSAMATFATVQVSAVGAGATFPSSRFEIIVNVTSPLTAKVVLRGTITTGTITPTRAGGVTLDFDSPLSEVLGGMITMNQDPLGLNAPNINAGLTVVIGSVTPLQPTRLLVKSTGYGPRGAKRELEAIVRRSVFDGGKQPSTLTLVGPPAGFVYNPGLSLSSFLSGRDSSSGVIVPPVGVTNATNLVSVETILSSLTVTVTGRPAIVSDDIPSWLQSTSALNAAVNQLRTIAKASGRYYTATPPNFGDNAGGKGITFVDGNATFTGAGGGILVVTGNLTMHNSFNFNGLILVTGSGGVDCSGVGSGLIEGGVVVAPYNPVDLAAGFSGPKFNLSAGTLTVIRIDFNNSDNSLNAVNAIVQGVAEK